MNTKECSAFTSNQLMVSRLLAEQFITDYIKTGATYKEHTPTYTIRLIRYTKGSLLTMSLSHRNHVTFSIFPRWEQFIPTLGIIIRLSISRVCCVYVDAAIVYVEQILF